MGRKPNCWEFMKCELGPGGKRVADRGICPAATNRNLNGVNGGFNAGRTCWAINDTLCKGGTQSDFVNKCFQCINCEFYIKTYKEEKFPREKSTIELLKKASVQRKP